MEYFHEVLASVIKYGHDERRTIYREIHLIEDMYVFMVKFIYFIDSWIILLHCNIMDNNKKFQLVSFTAKT